MLDFPLYIKFSLDLTSRDANDRWKLSTSQENHQNPNKKNSAN